MRGDAAGGGGVCVSPGGGGLGEGGGRRLRRERKAVDCLAGQRAVGGVETAAGAPGRLWAPGRVKGGREGRERGHSPRGRVPRSLSANSHLFFAPPLPSQPFTQTKPTMASALASRTALTSAVSARKVRMHAEGGANRVPVPPMPAREGDEKEGPPTGRRKKKKRRSLPPVGAFWVSVSPRAGPRRGDYRPLVAPQPSSPAIKIPDWRVWGGVHALPHPPAGRGGGEPGRTRSIDRVGFLGGLAALGPPAAGRVRAPQPPPVTRTGLTIDWARRWRGV